MITETFITINQLRWWRLIGAFKLFRVARFLKYLQNASELLHHYYYSKLVIRYFVLICIGLHWLTCIYITMEQSTQVYSLYLHLNENEFEDMEILSFNYETLLLLDYGHMYVYAQSIVATQILCKIGVIGVNFEFFILICCVLIQGLAQLIVLVHWWIDN